MTGRYFHLAVVLFWLVAMSWLVSQKIMPTLRTGEPPDYDVSLNTNRPHPPEPVCWRIEWEGRVIGTAVSQPVPTAEGTELRSVIRFTRLPVRNLVGQLLGAMAPLVTSSLGGEDFTPNMNVATRMRFDDERRLDNFQTVVDLPDLPQFIDLDGRVNDAGKLQLVASARFAAGGPGETQVVRHRHELDLPRDALVGDSLAPRSELRNLRVGQEWTIPTYRPFPPNSPVQILLARVEKSEFIQFNGELVETLVIVYHDEAGTGIGTARTPIGRTWVQPDGTVLRQQLMLSNLRITFDRLGPGEAREAAQWLEDEAFAKLFDGL